MASQAPPFKPRASSHPKKKQKSKNEVASTSQRHQFSLAQPLDEVESVPSRGSSRAAKVRKRQEAEDYVDAAISKRILAEARKQQLEMEKSRDEETELAVARRAFSSIVDNLSSDEEDEDEAFSDSQSQYEEFDELPEEDERIMSMFMAENAGHEPTLADVILEKIKGETPGITIEGEKPVPAVDSKIIEIYRGVGKLLSRFRSGKMPKAFKVIPSLSNWEEILYLTEPENWSANAMYQATRIFASNLNAKMAQRFYNLVLLPRVRRDIKMNKRLHFALYQSLKKAVFKPSAFFKGILLPICQSRTCNLREAVIVGSVIQKVSIPSLHSSAGLLKIAEMDYCGTNSYFMKLLLDKKYSLPYRVIDGVLEHFMRFLEEDRPMPVIWHQCLLTFVQRYKNELSKDDKDNLDLLMQHHKHYLVTPEIKRELQHSLHRGEKITDTIMHNASPISVVHAPIMEDIWNLPEVPIVMEE
eukprot:c25690_g1_i2 orf=206-1621(+)